MTLLALTWTSSCVFAHETLNGASGTWSISARQSLSPYPASMLTRTTMLELKYAAVVPLYLFHGTRRCYKTYHSITVHHCSLSSFKALEHGSR